MFLFYCRYILLNLKKSLNLKLKNKLSLIGYIQDVNKYVRHFWSLMDFKHQKDEKSLYKSQYLFIHIR